MMRRLLIGMTILMMIGALYYFSRVQEGVRGKSKKAPAKKKSISGRNDNTAERMSRKMSGIMPTRFQ